MVRRLTQEEFIERSTTVHNGKYCYKDIVYTNRRTKILLNCPEHGEFYQRAGEHMVGRGCLKCGAQSRGDNTLQRSRDTFVERANKIHSNKYQYDMGTFKSMTDRMTISCPIHGKFSQLAYSHVEGKGCRLCANIEYGKVQIAESRSQFYVRASEAHNNKYNYSKVVYITARDLVTIICPIHGDFDQEAHSHLSGRGCPNCAKYGFNSDKPATLYVLITDGGFIGFGITGKLKNRLAAHKRNLRDKNIEIIDAYLFSGEGFAVLDAESYIKRTFANSNVFIEGFKTEAFTNDRLPLVLEYLRSRDDLK